MKTNFFRKVVTTPLLVGMGVASIAFASNDLRQNRPLKEVNMKSYCFCFFIFLVGLCCGIAPSFANQSTWDPGCQCYVEDYSGPDMTPADGENPLPPFDPPAGRCVTGPPGLNGNTAGVGDVNVPIEDIDPCDLESSQACGNPDGRKHLVYVSDDLKRDGNLRDKLVVVLPGVGKDPANIKYLLKSAAYAGFRTIGLAYQGKELKACKSDGGTLLDAGVYSECVDRLRQETLYGGEFLEPVSSIKQRLIALLEELHSRDPTGGWDGYLKGSDGTVDLRYPKIIIAGYSLGSGHAAYWAKDQKFGGVVTLAGPTDHTDIIYSPSPQAEVSTFLSLATWITGAHATPGDRRAALLHLGEGEEKLEVIGKAWDAFGLSAESPKDLTHAWDAGYGGQVDDNLHWPYLKPKQRFTINTATGNCNAHEATAEDRCVVKDMDSEAGVPRVFGVYMHLFCVASDLHTDSLNH